MRLKYYFTGKKTNLILSTWSWTGNHQSSPGSPAICSSGDLQEEVKLELASIEFDKPKDNISTGERQALIELSRNQSVILKKSGKGNTTVLMSRQDKLNEGQVLLNDSNNYRPLDKTMVETTTKKGQQLIKTVLPEGHIAKTAAKWLSLIRLILRKSQCFTHLLKSTNRHLSEDLLSQGVPDLQNGSQHLLTTLFSQ